MDVKEDKGDMFSFEDFKRALLIFLKEIEDINI